MPRNVVEKIAEAHRASVTDARAGSVLALRPRHVLTHDNSAAVIDKFREAGFSHVADPRQPVIALDHDIQDPDPHMRENHERIARFAAEEGIDFFPAGTGIGHQLMVERGYVRPGTLVVAADSHANTYGALGALGTPVVRSDAAGIWACGKFWWRIPPTIRVVLEGRPPAGVRGKDLILTLCATEPADLALGRAVEFAGPGVEHLTLEERITVANMTTEWGALSGWFPPFEDTDDVAPDPGARYEREIRVRLDRLVPFVTGPDSVRAGRPLAEVRREKIRIDKAYLVSCTHSRHDDLRRAADALAGRPVAPGVELYVAAASRAVRDDLERDGTWSRLLEAGAIPLPSGCGPCIGLGRGVLRRGETAISTSNRNSPGRMGSALGRAWLADPAVVGASAAAGFITGPDTAEAPGDPPLSVGSSRGREDAVPDRDPTPSPPGLTGRAWLVAQDGVTTDTIFPADRLYRDGRGLPFGRHDPAFGARARPGDILVAGARFGSGSSREQAVSSLAEHGIRAVLAGGFHPTYLRNALNLGMPCWVAPTLHEHMVSVYGRPPGVLLTEDPVEILPDTGCAVWRGREHSLEALPALARRLLRAGGLMPLLRDGGWPT